MNNHQRQARLVCSTLKMTLGSVFVLMLMSPVLQSSLGSTGSRVLDAPRIHVKNSDFSTNWSGYAVASNLSSPSSNFFKSVTGSWIVPALSCTLATSYSAIWVGIDGYSGNTVEQIGTEQDCSGGTQNNYAWFEMYPKATRMITTVQVHAGDLITASVQHLGGNQFSVSIKNLSVQPVQSFSKTVKATGGSQLSSVEWIVEAPSSGGVQPLANFRTVSINGATFATSDSPRTFDPVNGLGPGTMTDVKMVDQSGVRIIAVPSALDPTGTSFTVAYAG